MYSLLRKKLKVGSLIGYIVIIVFPDNYGLNHVGVHPGDTNVLDGEYLPLAHYLTWLLGFFVFNSNHYHAAFADENKNWHHRITVNKTNYRFTNHWED